MPQSEIGAGSHYPLASSSNSRRRLLLFGLTGPTIELPYDGEEQVDARGLSVVFDDPSHLNPPSIAEEGKVDSRQLAAAGESRPSFLPVQQLLTKTKPLTWVFTGDSVTAGQGLDDNRRNYVELFAAQLKRQRMLDAVINTAAPGETADDLLEDVEWRSLRFRPDVVVLMLGIDDATAGPDNCDQFRDRVLRLVECIRSDGGLPVLQTPHRVSDASSVNLSALRTHVKALRQIAGHAHVPCIDHWGRWKRKESGGTAIKDWLGPEGLHPSAAGHGQLASLICACFGLQSDESAARGTVLNASAQATRPQVMS